MILANASIVDDNFNVRNLDLRIEEEKIVEIGKKLSGEERMDMSGMYIMPGFIDTHIHGACGIRIEDCVQDFSPLTEFEVTQGVTGIAITAGSDEFSNMLENISNVVKFAEKNRGTKILGIHAEAPFVNPKRKGAMRTEYLLEPDIEKLDCMITQAQGLLKIITIAPELPGALEFIQYAVAKGLKVSLGHTDATIEEARKGIAAGASQATHTFNAMRSYNHREPGVLGAVLLDSSITCEMICDFVHLHPDTVKLIYRLKTADKIRMISDSGTATGLDISEFEVHGVKRYVKDKVVRLADGTIAGSAMSLGDGVKNLLVSGIPMGDVAKMSSFNPAKSLGMEALTGSISVGKLADLAVLDTNFDVQYTFVNGKCMYRKRISVSC